MTAAPWHGGASGKRRRERAAPMVGAGAREGGRGESDDSEKRSTEAPATGRGGPGIEGSGVDRLRRDSEGARSGGARSGGCRNVHGGEPADDVARIQTPTAVAPSPRSLVLRAAAECERWHPSGADWLRAVLASPGRHTIDSIGAAAFLVRNALADYQPSPGLADGWGRLTRDLRAALTGSTQQEASHAPPALVGAPPVATTTPVGREERAVPSLALLLQPAPDPLLAMSEHVDRAFAAGLCPLCDQPMGPGRCERVGPELICRRPRHEERPMTTTAPRDDREPTYETDYDPSTGETHPLARRPDAAPLAQRRLADPAALEVPNADGSRLATSGVIREVMAALCTAQAGYERVVKRHKADAGSRGAYSYANLADVAAAVMPSLREAGLFVMQVPCGDVLVTRITHGESGQWIEGAMPLIKPDARGGVQALGSALTYTRRYTLVAMLGIVPEDDDDGAQGSGKPAPKLPARVAELAGWRDPAGARAVLVAEMAERGVPADVQGKALADFDGRVQARAGAAP